MEIEQLNSNKFKIFLHTEDFERYNIDLDSFLSEKIENQPIFLDILNYLDKNLLINLDNKSISINTLLLNHSDIVITVLISRLYI
jgi:negative regulator of genetic competence, sporulation and motility